MTEADGNTAIPPTDESVESPDPQAAVVARDRWRVLRPLAHRDFRVLFSAVVLSIFAAGMWAVVMVYAVIAVGGGPIELSLVAASNATGLLLCAIPGGIVADRISRRLIVRAVSLADFIAISSVVIVGLSGPVGIPQLVVVAFVLGAGAGFFFPAYSAILPRILPPGQLLAANGLEGAIRPALQQAAGPATAGMLLAALVPAHAAVIIAIAHGAAFVLLLFLRPEPVEPGGAGSGGDGSAAADHSAKSVFHDLREAVVFTVRTPWLLWTLLYATLWVLVAVGPEEVLLPFLIRERIGDDPRLFGFLLAVYGAGGVLGSIFVSSRKLPRRYLTTMNLVWGVSTLPFIIVGFTDQYWLLLASMFTIGFGFSYGNVIWGTLLQRRVPRHMLGRISSLDFFVSLALMPLSMALAGPLAEVLSLQAIFTAAGVLTLTFGIIAIFAARMPQDEIAHPLGD
jgi:MFS family permease